MRGRSDTKMAALAPPLASPSQNVSYFLDSPRNYRFIAYLLNTAEHVSGILLPIIRSLSTALASSGLLLPPRSNGKPEAAAAVDRLLMMGISMPETC